MDESGIEGWAVDLENPSTPINLELLIEDSVVARCTTEHDRTDLSHYLGDNCQPGFGFDPAVMQTLQRLHRAVPNGRLRICLARQKTGKQLALRSVAGTPTLAKFFATENPEQSIRASSAHDLLARMSKHRAEVTQKLQRPFRPLPDNTIGFVEAVMQDGNYIWLIGWMHRGHVTDQPVLILDKQKIPAALSFFYFERADLPSEASGFIGLLIAEWLPSPGTQAYMFLGNALQSQLETLKPLAILDGDAFGDWLDDRLPTAFGSNVRVLQQVLAGVESWSVVRSAGGFTAKAALDNLLVLPHFGVMAEGWILCPSKRSVSMVLRFGDSVLGCDLASIRRTTRADLLPAAGGLADVTQRAGFVAAFPGLLPVSELRQAVLKIVYEDDTTSNHVVDPAIIARLSPKATLEAALALFPALLSEPFFRSFARALIADLAPITRSWLAHKVTAASQVIVVTLPEAISDIFFLFAELTRFAEATPTQVGIVILGRSGDLRAITLQLFTQFTASRRIAGSLFFLEDTDYALYYLSAILLAVGAESFAFVGRPAVLTQTGWQAATEIVTANAMPELTLLGVQDPVAQGIDAMSARCFAWNRWAFADWIADQPILMGGACSLSMPAADGTQIPGLAHLIAPVTLSIATDAVNAAAAA